jgi:hypothetical protein
MKTDKYSALAAFFGRRRSLPVSVTNDAQKASRPKKNGGSARAPLLGDVAGEAGFSSDGAPKRSEA